MSMMNCKLKRVSLTLYHSKLRLGQNFRPDFDKMSSFDYSGGVEDTKG